MSTERDERSEGRWSVAEDELLRAYGYRGVAFVREVLLGELGVVRSERAIEMRASRIDVSLKRVGVCPACGAVGVRLNSTSGMCGLCTAEMRLEEERAFNELLELEATGCDSGEALERARREYARLRKRNSRLCKKYRLQGKRGR